MYLLILMTNESLPRTDHWHPPGRCFRLPLFPVLGKLVLSSCQVTATYHGDTVVTASDK